MKSVQICNGKPEQRKEEYSKCCLMLYCMCTTVSTDNCFILHTSEFHLHKVSQLQRVEIRVICRPQKRVCVVLFDLDTTLNRVFSCWGFTFPSPPRVNSPELFTRKSQNHLIGRGARSHISEDTVNVVRTGRDAFNDPDSLVV